MTGSPSRRPRRKRAGRYHHGDLRRALIDEALRIVDKLGPEALTLRGVGDALGVSRTALYRHFADKQALVAAVAREGFRTLRLALVEAWETQGRGWAGFEAMGEAYFQFAIAHPAHYRVMFGRFTESTLCDPELAVDPTVTDDASMVERRAGRVVVVAGDPVNRKITHPDDLEWARGVLAAGTSERVSA